MTIDNTVKKEKRGKNRVWKLKGCPKCKGDMLIEKYRDARYEWCLQCGYQDNMELARVEAPSRK